MIGLIVAEVVQQQLRLWAKNSTAYKGKFLLDFIQFNIRVLKVLSL